VPAPLPPPLPPETRTVGQVVAETIRLYGRKLWPGLLLGIPVAIEHQLAIGRSLESRALLLVAFAPAFALVAALAAAASAEARPSRGAVLRATLVGTLLFLPAAALFPWFILASVAWLALVGLAVPVAVLEGAGLRAAVVRGLRLGRVDYVHAVGSLAALFVVFVLVRMLLVQLLHAQADHTVRVAAFLADTFLSPLLFFGAALLYVDQEARSRLRGGDRLPRR
jgi:hypothetical protein